MSNVSEDRRGCAMGQAVSRFPLTAEARGLPKLYGICGGQSGNVFPCQYDATSAPYTVHLSPTPRKHNTVVSLPHSVLASYPHGSSLICFHMSTDS